MKIKENLSKLKDEVMQFEILEIKKIVLTKDELKKSQRTNVKLIENHQEKFLRHK